MLKKIWKDKVKNIDAENFILTLMYKWHVGGSTWYTSDLQVVSNDIEASVPP
jgi:hypothetical protein